MKSFRSFIQESNGKPERPLIYSEFVSDYGNFNGEDGKPLAIVGEATSEGHRKIDNKDGSWSNDTVRVISKGNYDTDILTHEIKDAQDNTLHTVTHRMSAIVTRGDIPSFGEKHLAAVVLKHPPLDVSIEQYIPKWRGVVEPHNAAIRMRLETSKGSLSHLDVMRLIGEHLEHKGEKRIRTIYGYHRDSDNGNILHSNLGMHSNLYLNRIQRRKLIDPTDPIESNDEPRLQRPSPRPYGTRDN